VQQQPRQPHDDPAEGSTTASIPEVVTMDRQDVGVIEAALSELPKQCRYHGDRTDPPDGLIRREACCDTGVAAHRRKAAEEVLARLRR
jgi:hypothetical protein